MAFGGIDVVMKAPANAPVADVILRASRIHWPDCVFQDEGEAAVHPLTDPTVWLNATASKEFFIYRDRAAAEVWDDVGFTPKDPNSMLYVILEESPDSSLGGFEVTIVCGKMTKEMKKFLKEIDMFLQSPRYTSWIPMGQGAA